MALRLKAGHFPVCPWVTADFLMEEHTLGLLTLGSTTLHPLVLSHTFLPCEDETLLIQSGHCSLNLLCPLKHCCLRFVLMCLALFSGPPNISGDVPAVLPLLSACFTQQFRLFIGLFWVSLASYPDKSNFKRV